MHKTCPACQQSKKIIEFNKNKSKPDGLQRVCRECQKIINQQHYQKHKQKQIVRAKKNKQKSQKRAYEYLHKRYPNPKCEQCGESDTRCLQFHHIDPNKRECSISDLCYKGYGIAKIKKELDKCILVCANCHCKIHNKTRWCNS